MARELRCQDEVLAHIGCEVYLCEAFVIELLILVVKAELVCSHFDVTELIFVDLKFRLSIHVQLLYLHHGLLLLYLLSLCNIVKGLCVRFLCRG